MVTNSIQDIIEYLVVDTSLLAKLVWLELCKMLKEVELRYSQHWFGNVVDDVCVSNLIVECSDLIQELLIVSISSLH